MFFLKPLSTCSIFINELNDSLKSMGERPLTRAQSLWISICITGVLVTNSVCWKRFERACFGEHRSNTLSKMFCRGKLFWDQLLRASVYRIIEAYDITSGVLALDGTDNKRSKNTTTIAKVHKLKDKSSGGYVMGQSLTLLLLITDKVTVPVGFEFYEPDPKQKQWLKEYQVAKKAGLSKASRPKRPERNSDYLTQTEVALNLIRRFKTDFPSIKIKAILADAYYGSNNFFSEAALIAKDVQLISQVKKNQKIKHYGRYKSIEMYFNAYGGVERKISIRGEEKTVIIHGARLYLKAHGCKRFIIALKYEGETEYRYLVASELTWRLTDIAAGYTLRWLVEVFIQDWKSYEGWCQLAKQPGVEGTRKGVILSLLTDHFLLLHKDQMALIKDKLPAATVGSLRDRERAKAMIEAIEMLVQDKNDAKSIASQLRISIENIIPLRPSQKHMGHKKMPSLEPASSLTHLKAA